MILLVEGKERISSYYIGREEECPDSKRILFCIGTKISISIILIVKERNSISQKQMHKERGNEI